MSNFPPIPLTLIMNKMNKMDTNNESYKNDDTNENYSPVTTIFILLISFGAAILSWYTNTKAGYSIEIKLACALVAFNFGIFYFFYWGLAVHFNSNYKLNEHHCKKYSENNVFSSTSL